MNEKILEALKKSDYFKKYNINIENLTKISKYFSLINTNKAKYGLISFTGVNDINFILENFNKINELSLKALETIKLDNNQFILLEDYNFKKLAKSKDDYKIGLSLGKKLRNLHKIKPHIKKDWNEAFTTKSNYLFYMHGVSDIGDDDYILIDYIRDNIHLTKNLVSTYMYPGLDVNNILINENEDILLTGLDFSNIGDGVFDFVWVNKIAIDNKNLAKGIFDGYFSEEKASIKFFRLLSLYQAYVILDNIVALRNDKETYLSEEEIKSLQKMYDNYNQYIPSWIKES